MAKGINKVILLGHLGKNPDLKYMTNGSPVTHLTLATTESWKDRQSGNKQERTEWHRIVIFGKLAEIANQYLCKGSLVYIEGQLQTRKWTDNMGHTRYTTEVIVNNMNGTIQMLDRKEHNTIHNTQQNSYDNNKQHWPVGLNTEELDNIMNEPFDVFDQDIPF